MGAYAKVAALLGLLLLQPEHPTFLDESADAIITLIATHPDGRPVKGHIACSGYWIKHADEEIPPQGESFPFVTDMRGAIILNPAFNEGDFFQCRAVDRNTGSAGVVTFSIDAVSMLIHINVP